MFDARGITDMVVLGMISFALITLALPPLAITGLWWLVAPRTGLEWNLWSVWAVAQAGWFLACAAFVLYEETRR